MIHFNKPAGFASDFSAVGCFVESGGQILQLLRAGDRKIEPGKWGSPAGRIEHGETPELAIAREIAEEIGIRISQDQLDKIGSVFVFYPNASFEYFMFKLRFTYKPEITLSSEHTAFVWISPEEACSLYLMLDEWEVIKLAYQL